MGQEWNGSAPTGTDHGTLGPEMGWARNGTGPKWDTRNQNGKLGTEMGWAWSGTGPKWPGPKWPVLTVLVPLLVLLQYGVSRQRNQGKEREVQFLHWINNQLRVAKAASVVPKGRSPSVRMWPSRLKPTELKKKAVSGLRTIVLNTSTSNHCPKHSVFCPCVTHYGYCKFKNIYKRTNLK